MACRIAYVCNEISCHISLDLQSLAATARVTGKKRFPVSGNEPALAVMFCHINAGRTGPRSAITPGDLGRCHPHRISSPITAGDAGHSKCAADGSLSC